MRAAASGRATSFETPTSFETHCARLVRHLFEVGLQLNAAQAVFDDRHSEPHDIRAARLALSGVLEDVDLLVHDTGMAMLALLRETAPQTGLTHGLL